MVNNSIIYLKIAFEDPNEKNTFQDKLQKLKQTNCALSDYFETF